MEVDEPTNIEGGYKNAVEAVQAGKVVFNLPDTATVDQVVLIARTIDNNGTIGIALGLSEGSSWVDDYGLISTAKFLIENDSPFMKTDNG